MDELGSRVVLVTGGTRGLGKAIGLEFSRAGATVYLTHRWGSVSAEELTAEFRAEGLAAPCVIESDVSDDDATIALMRTIRSHGRTLDVIVSNVAFSKLVRDLADLTRSALELSMGYSAWPVVELVRAAYTVLGRYPRYVIAVSSNGAEVCHEGYDLVGASKAVLETLCRYLALRLKGHGVRINIIRPGFLDTASSRATLGEEVVATLKERVPEIFLDPRQVARVCLALTTGWMDAVTGQVIIVDEGWSLVGPIAYLTGGGLPGAFSEPDVGLG